MKKLFFLIFVLFLVKVGNAQPTIKKVFDTRVQNNTTNNGDPWALTNSTGALAFDTLKVIIVAGGTGAVTDSTHIAIYAQAYQGGRWGTGILIDSLSAFGSPNAFYTDSLRRINVAANKALADTIRAQWYVGTPMLSDATGKAIMNQKTDWKIRIYVVGLNCPLITGTGPKGNAIAGNGGPTIIYYVEWD